MLQAWRDIDGVHCARSADAATSDPVDEPCTHRSAHEVCGAFV